jgi:hypothetical protein
LPYFNALHELPNLAVSRDAVCSCLFSMATTSKQSETMMCGKGTGNCAILTSGRFRVITLGQVPHASEHERF